MDIGLKERVREFLEVEVSEAYKLRHLSGLSGWAKSYDGDFRYVMNVVVDYLNQRNLKLSTRIFGIGKVEVDEILGIIFGEEKEARDENLPRQEVLEAKASTSGAA